MASKTVRLHPEAEREYLEALAWYRDRSVVVASEFELAVSRAVHAIEAAPPRWPSYFGEFRRSAAGSGCERVEIGFEKSRVKLAAKG